MWFPSQFPLTLNLVKQLQWGELLPEPIQLSRLGFGRTRAVFSLPASALNTAEEGVLKLCMVRQHHGKEFEWGAHCSLVAPTYLKGQISVDFGVQARYLHFSVQRKATLASNWVAQFGGNVSLTHDLALYALCTLLALELRGAVLCPHPIPPDDLRGRGWVERPPQDPQPPTVPTGLGVGRAARVSISSECQPRRVSPGGVQQWTQGEPLRVSPKGQAASTGRAGLLDFDRGAWPKHYCTGACVCLAPLTNLPAATNPLPHPLPPLAH